MNVYQRIIKSIDATINPRYVEAFMRLEYKTLDHLSIPDFEREIDFFRSEFDHEEESYWEHLAQSYGL